MWGHGAAEETVGLPWGATTSKAKSLNRATVGRISRSPGRTCQRAEASRVGAPASSAQKKPRRSGVPTGASKLRSVCGGDDPHVAMVLQRRRLHRVLAITVQCKTCSNQLHR